MAEESPYTGPSGGASGSDRRQSAHRHIAVAIEDRSGDPRGQGRAAPRVVASGRGALARDPDHAREVLHRFADRLMFGRDYYGKDLHEFLQSLDLPTDVSERIYFRNAAALVGPQRH